MSTKSGEDQNVGTVLAKLKELGIEDNTIDMYSTDNGFHMNSRPDAAMTPFHNEKNSNWEGAYRVPAMVRWPRKIKPGSVSNGIVSHLYWVPTLLPAAGVPDVKERLLAGYQAGNTTYKVHLDGYNLLSNLTGAEQKSPRKEFLFLRRQRSDWSTLRQLEIRLRGAAGAWDPPGVGRTFHPPSGAALVYNLRLDPYERANITSNTYYDWLLDHAFMLVPAQAYVGRFLGMFKDHPPRQKAASFSIDQALEKSQHPSGD